MADDQVVLAAYMLEVERVREQVLKQVELVWTGFGSYRDADVARMVTLLVPRVQAGQVRIANLTAAYLAKIGAAQAPVDRELVVGGRGVDPAIVYGRPAVTVRTALSRGASFADAVQQGSNRLASIASMDMQMAKVRQADASLSRSEWKFYRRTLTGRENCALCIIASTQRYRRGDLMPIHPGCDCGVEPIKTAYDPGQVIDAELLEQAYDLARPELKAALAAGEPKHLRDLLITRDHGEFGPTLAWRGRRFTSADDLAA